MDTSCHKKYLFNVGFHSVSDENKFGQKMLERMGWKKGRGLGLNEDGQTEHVKVTHKNDQKGTRHSVKHSLHFFLQ